MKIILLIATTTLIIASTSCSTNEDGQTKKTLTHKDSVELDRSNRKKQDSLNDAFIRNKYTDLIIVEDIKKRIYTIDFQDEKQEKYFLIKPDFIADISKHDSVIVIEYFQETFNDNCVLYKITVNPKSFDIDKLRKLSRWSDNIVVKGKFVKCVNMKINMTSEITSEYSEDQEPEITNDIGFERANVLIFKGELIEYLKDTDKNHEDN